MIQALKKKQLYMLSAYSEWKSSLDMKEKLKVTAMEQKIVDGLGRNEPVVKRDSSGLKKFKYKTKTHPWRLYNYIELYRCVLILGSKNENKKRQSEDIRKAQELLKEYKGSKKRSKKKG